MPLGQGSIQSLKLGQLGSDYITDTNPHTGQWGRIHAVAAATFTTLTSGNNPAGTQLMTLNGSSGALATMVIPAGDEIWGLFTAITLAGGKVIAYRI